VGSERQKITTVGSERQKKSAMGRSVPKRWAQVDFTAYEEEDTCMSRASVLSQRREQSALKCTCACGERFVTG